MNSVQSIPYGKYQHYRSEKYYEVIGIARHSETLEEMVIYKALYQCDKFGENHIWVRPKAMFFGLVEHNGHSVSRFKQI
jgi:hypothetical protein